MGFLRESAEQLQKMIEELQPESFGFRLKLNMNKSKLIIKKHTEFALFSMGNKMLERVEGYHCLRQMVIGDPSHDKVIRRSIEMVW